MDNQFTITRSNVCNYLFNIHVQDGYNGYWLAVNRTFEECQDILGIISEDYSKIDDGRYMLLI